jgi:phenylacetic acid degradation operon negative regulatory protein
MASKLTVVSESVTGNAVAMPTRPRPARLVTFLFGLTGRTELAGPVLVALLCDLGGTPAASRAAIARLRAEGNLAASRHGRQVRYRLAGELASGFTLLRNRPMATPSWPGYFHALLHHIPEQHRAFRDRLRRTAALSGFGLLGPGILISTRERWADLAAVLDLAPADAVLYQARLALEEADAARAAAQAWNLAELDRRYLAHRDTLRRALAEPQMPTGPAALHRYSALVSPAMVDTFRAPVLPEPLYPADWSLPELRATIGAVNRAYTPAIRAHLADRFAQAGEALDDEG